MKPPEERAPRLGNFMSIFGCPFVEGGHVFRLDLDARDTVVAGCGKKIHPDMEVGTTFENYDKLRTIVSTNVYQIEDMVSAAR